MLAPSRFRRRSLQSFATLILVASACEGSREVPEPTGETKPPAVSLDSTEWEAASLLGRPIIPGTRITLTFNRGSAGGFGGCNWFGGSYTTNGAALHVREIGGTGRGCVNPASIAEQEAALYGALQAATAYRIVNNQLSLLMGPDQQPIPGFERPRFDTLASWPVIAVFEARFRPAMNPGDLVGTKWRLESVNGVRQPGDSILTLEFTDSVIRGFAGCRNYTGTYRAVGNRIAVPSITMATTECHRGNAANRREGDFTTDLSEVTHYVLDDDRLELETAPGRTIVFRKAGRATTR